MTSIKQGEGGAVSEARDKGAELVSSAQDQIETKAGELRDEASFQVREQVDQRSTQAGQHISAVGRALGSSARQLEGEGRTSSAQLVDKVAGGAQKLGDYLRSADAERILGDVERFARRRPWATASAAAIAGFAASRFVKASSDRRYDTSPGQREIAAGPGA
jgi:hypothetical protein